MTTREVLQALLDGKKIRPEGRWPDDDFIYMKDGQILGKCGNDHTLFLPPNSDYELYQEPKPKVMRAQYAYYDRGEALRVSPHLYCSDEEFSEDNPDYDGWFKRLQEIECES